MQQASLDCMSVLTHDLAGENMLGGTGSRKAGCEPCKIVLLVVCVECIN